MTQLKFASAILAAALFSTLAFADEISCHSVEKAAGNVFQRVSDSKNKNDLVVAQEARKAFWDIYHIAPKCPAIVKLAEQMEKSGVGEKAKGPTQEELLKSFQNSWVRYCGSASCKIGVVTPPTGNTQGSEAAKQEFKEFKGFEAGKLEVYKGLSTPSKQ